MQKKFVNGSMAAQIIGISYKTLKDRYDHGWIIGERTAQGKLKFALDEVERAKKAWQEERSQFISSADLNTPEAPRSDLEDRITELEEEVALLKMQVAKLQQDQIIPFSELFQQPAPKPDKAYVIDASTSKDPLPQGCMLATQFAKQYGVSRGTIRDQLDKGKIAFESRPKPGRTGETERYFTPGQQHAALAYWRDRGHLA